MQLAVGPRWSEKTQQESVTGVLRYRGSASCYVKGYPRVSLFDRRGRALRFVVAHRGDQMITNRKPALIAVKPGESVYFALNKNVCQVRVTAYAVELHVGLPGMRGTAALKLPRHYRLGYCGRGYFGKVAVSPLVARLAQAAARA